MTITHQTISFCPVCYLEVPARISVKGGDLVRMFKHCPHHGDHHSIVEKDALFYQAVRSINAPSIYNGHFVDVTRVCNLRCERCYYHLEKEDPAGEYSVEAILNECRVNRNRAPFILTGGEPTMRSDISELIAKVKTIGPVELLSNGTKLASSEMFDAVMPLLTEDGEANLNLSLHLKETDKWMEVIARCRATGLKIESALIVINNKEEFLKAVELAKSLKDVVLSFRIKAASLLWAEQGVESKIFVSDMLNWLDDTAQPVRWIPQRHNKVSIVNVMYEGVFLMLVSWYDASNVDLVDIDCAPFYRARNGEVKNFVTACIINEGMERGFIKGRKIK
jgi:organic radical activating enzyme